MYMYLCRYYIKRVKVKEDIHFLYDHKSPGTIFGLSFWSLAISKYVSTSLICVALFSSTSVLLLWYCADLVLVG